MTATAIPILDLEPEIDALWDEFSDAFQRVLRSGQFIKGPELDAFEREVADYLGTKHAIGVNSGTDALVVGLRALGIGPGDEVVTTPFSFFATAESISAVGATPVFADIDARTFNLDPDTVEPLVTERTAAVMPVHLYGGPAAIGPVLEIAERHGLAIIEDCAQSFGARFVDAAGGDGMATWHGKRTGTVGAVGAYSFFPSKNLGAFGDAGLVTTDDDALAEHMRKLRAHGALKKYHNEEVGYNSRLDALQAAFLRVKLPHIGDQNAGRRRVAETYNRLLADVEGVVAPAVVPGHVFHQYTVRILGGKRDAAAAALKAQGIQTMIYYPVPQHRLPVYDHLASDCPVSDQLAGEVLSLPIWPQLDEATIRHIAGALAEAVR
ncbi:MAG: DegT/DnrJ/EryC1/StrS family aminotransferase [Bacteroidota bacterium]